jgi:hypothetical protein
MDIDALLHHVCTHIARKDSWMRVVYGAKQSR